MIFEPPPLSLRCDYIWQLKLNERDKDCELPVNVHFNIKFHNAKSYKSLIKVRDDSIWSYVQRHILPLLEPRHAAELAFQHN